MKKIFYAVRPYFMQFVPDGIYNFKKIGMIKSNTKATI